MFLFQILFLEMITFKCAKPNNPGGIHITVPGLELKQELASSCLSLMQLLRVLNCTSLENFL